MADDVSPRARHGVSVLMAVLSASLLVWVVRKNGGLEMIGSVVDRLGWTWVLLLVPTTLSAFTIILAYRACLPDGGRAVPFRALVQIERAGNALNAFMPFGDSSGNIMKVALLRHWYTSEQIVAAGAWSSIGTGATNAYAALGPLVALGLGALPARVAVPLATLSIAMSLPAVVILLLLRTGLAARVAKLIGRVPLAAVRTRRERILAWARRLDTHVASAVHDKKREFRRVLAWKIGQQTLRIGQLWMVVELLGLEGGLAAAVAYNAMRRGIQQFLPFIPGRLGVVEVMTGGLFVALGWPSEDGVQFALVLRFGYVVSLVFSATALTNSHKLAARFPPRSRETLEALAADPAANSGA